jgi:hypothetical protein
VPLQTKATRDRDKVKFEERKKKPKRILKKKNKKTFSDKLRIEKINPP